MKNRSPKTGIHVARGVVSIFLANALILPTGFVTAIVLAHKLGPVDYGLFALVASIILWFELLVFTGLANTTVKFTAETPEWKAVGTTAIQLYLFVGLSTCFLLWMSAETLAELLSEPKLAGYLKLFAIDIPLFGLACAHQNILIGISRFHEQAKVTAIRLITRLALIVLFVTCGFSVKGAIWGSIGASVAELICARYFIRFPFFSKKTFPVRRLLSFATPLFLATISFHTAGLDLIILKMFGGATVELGYYSAALNISIIPVLFFSSLSQPILTLLSRLLLEMNHNDTKKYTLVCFRLIFWLIPFVTLIAGSSSEIIELVFGTNFRPAGSMLKFLIFAGLATGIIILENTIFIAHNEPKMTLWCSALMVPFIFAGNFWLIPVMGGIGTAVVKTSVFGIMALIAGAIICWKRKIKLPALTVVSSAACSVMAYCVATGWSTSGSLLVLKMLLVSGFIFLVFILCKEIGSNELAAGKKIVQF